MRRRDFLIAAPAVLALPRPGRAAQPLSVLLDWFINPNHAPIVVADRIGAFQRRNLDVTLVQPADPAMPPRLVAAGHGDIAIGYQTMLYRQVLGGLPIRRIGALQDRSLASLAVLKSSGVATLADLKGRRVGYNEIGGDVALACIDLMLGHAHLSLADVSLVDVGTALTTSLLTRRVDAVTIVRNFEAFEIAEKGEVPICFDYEDYGVPPSDGFIFDVQADRVQDPRFPQFLAAVREGAAYVKAHPGDAWKLFLKAYPDLDDQLNQDAWNYTLPYFATDPAHLDVARYQAFADFLTSRKVIPRSPPVASYAVQLASAE